MKGKEQKKLQAYAKTLYYCVRPNAERLGWVRNSLILTKTLHHNSRNFVYNICFCCTFSWSLSYISRSQGEFDIWSERVSTEGWHPEIKVLLKHTLVTSDNINVISEKFNKIQPGQWILSMWGYNSLGHNERFSGKNNS